MASDFPIDKANLSFSGDQDATSLFITQSSFHNVDTLVVDNAAEYFEGLGDFKFGDESDQKAIELNSDMAKEVSQDEMCNQIFDFSDYVDNGYTVSTQDNPFIVTMKSDRKQFKVGKKSVRCVNSRFIQCFATYVCHQS